MPIKITQCTLLEATRQHDAWMNVPGDYAREMELFWAQKVHYLSTMALVAAQDRYHDDRGNAMGQGEG